MGLLWRDLSVGRSPLSPDRGSSIIPLQTWRAAATASVPPRPLSRCSAAGRDVRKVSVTKPPSAMFAAGFILRFSAEAVKAARLSSPQ